MQKPLRKDDRKGLRHAREAPQLPTSCARAGLAWANDGPSPVSSQLKPSPI